MPIIKINLKITKSRTFEVLVDNQIIGLLSNGEIKEYNVTEGRHKLKIKSGRIGSKDLDFMIFNNEIKIFTASKSKVLNYSLLAIILFLISPFLITNNIYLWLFPVVAPAFIILVLLIFFITTHRSYLILKEGE